MPSPRPKSVHTINGDRGILTQLDGTRFRADEWCTTCYDSPWRRFMPFGTTLGLSGRDADGPRCVDDGERGLSCYRPQKGRSMLRTRYGPPRRDPQSTNQARTPTTDPMFPTFLSHKRRRPNGTGDHRVLPQEKLFNNITVLQFYTSIELFHSITTLEYYSIMLPSAHSKT